MKRVKIMLATITVLASVGGALAFKARTFGQVYCIRALAVGSGLCTTSLIGETHGAITTYHFTITNNPSRCTNGNVQCVPTTKITAEP